eukprot:SAG25_NODE_5864_length_612_cov_0.884990_2_plen_75_part_01
MVRFIQRLCVYLPAAPQLAVRPAVAGLGCHVLTTTSALWRAAATGRKARIVVKNERNAALSWQTNKVGPFADHSL